MRSNTVWPAALLLASTSRAHVALWSKGMFGYNYPYQSSDTVNLSYNTNDPVIPLRAAENRTVDQWWAHGRLDYPPNEGDFLELEAGGVYTGELACNRADTKMRDPVRTDPQPDHACGGIGALHVVNNTFESTFPVNASALGGSALAIAYTSNYTSLQPNDMTIISVNYTSPWYRLTDYSIPADLPPCPEGGCICTWNWVHLAGHGEGDGEEIYNVMYRCKIVGGKTGFLVDTPKTSLLCEDDEGICVRGAKQPLYAYQASGNNMPWTTDPPTYNARYGFQDGAQSDIFIAAPPEPSSSSSSSSTIPTGTGTGSGGADESGGIGAPSSTSSPSAARVGRTIYWPIPITSVLMVVGLVFLLL